MKRGDCFMSNFDFSMFEDDNKSTPRNFKVIVLKNKRFPKRKHSNTKEQCSVLKVDFDDRPFDMSFNMSVDDDFIKQIVEQNSINALCSVNSSIMLLDLM